MQLKLKTATLQAMVSKSVKGASLHKAIPITGLMMIELRGKSLILTTTNGFSTLQIIESGVEGQDFFAVVPVELFSKLISKVTTESVMLSLKENGLEVRGNGVYMLDLALDESGNMIRFPEVNMPSGPGDPNVQTDVIETATIKSILSSNKAAVAMTMEIPHLTGYYCQGDKVITTDTFKVCSNAVKSFSSPVLLPAELVELLALASGATINAYREGSRIVFVGSDMILFGRELEGSQDYPVEAVESFLQEEFTQTVGITKTALLSALDRLSLFVSPYDEQGIYLTFAEDHLICHSKRNNSTEQVKYATGSVGSPFICCVDVELLKSQLLAHEAETITLAYGHPKAIRLNSGKITQILSLLEDGTMTSEPKS